MGRISVWLVALVTMSAVLSGCQSAFPRACLQSKDCERTPVNGPIVFGEER